MRTGAPPAASPATRPFGSARAPPPSVEQLHGSAILPHPYAPSTARAGYPYPSLPGHLYVSARIGPSGLPGACYRRARFSRLQSGSRQKERPLRRRGRVVRSTVVRREPQVGIEPTTARLRIECSTTELLWQPPCGPLDCSRGPASCPGADSNRDALRHHPLKMACLPISPPGRGSSLYPREPWGPALPTTGPTGLEPATSRVTVECSNQTELRPLNDRYEVWEVGSRCHPACLSQPVARTATAPAPPGNAPSQ